jgi:peptide/nickel transport system substrate-binding protein
MHLRALQLRLQRSINRQRMQVGGLSKKTERRVDEYFFKRFSRLSKVRRFVIGWIALSMLLIAGVMLQTFGLSRYYQTVQPVDGGIYNEGVVGTFTTANPIYATGEVDSSVSHLLFSGLFTHDQNNALVGDLATGYSYEAITNTYTVKLKPGLSWQDGRPLTSKDVVFTYGLIQNPDAQSPLQSSWKDIVVAAPDATTVTFKLPSQLASFPYTLTNGIVPEHLLGKVLPADMRTSDFNTVHPVGSGPFSWQAIEVSGGTDPTKAQEQIALAPFTNYHGGKPKLAEFVVHAYADKSQMTNDVQAGRLTGASGLNRVPSLGNNHTLQEHNFLLTAGTYVFFKTSSGLLADVKVRQSLTSGTNVPQIVSTLGYPTRQVKEPLLLNQIGYDPSLVQASFNESTANTSLQTDGWVLGADSYRTKDGKPLAFSLTAVDTPESRDVAKELAIQWKRIGVKVSLKLLSQQDFQNALNNHDYEAVLNGISIGLDPDVYVYWDSSQADIRSNNRLNLSEYKNSEADTALEAGRTRFDPQLRTVKYKPFLQAWQRDAPAIGLYQPRVLYLTNGTVRGLNDHTINTATDRYTNVNNWQIREARVTNTTR